MNEAEIIIVSSEHIRLDLIDPEPATNTLDRFSRIIDIDTARKLAIMLIKAISQCEVASAKKGKK